MASVWRGVPRRLAPVKIAGQTSCISQGSHMTSQIAPWQNFFLDMLHLAEEMGDCVLIRSLLKSGEAVENDVSFSSYLPEYRNVKERLLKALVFEELNGRGSLLNHAHPMNIQLSELGYGRT